MPTTIILTRRTLAAAIGSTGLAYGCQSAATGLGACADPGHQSSAFVDRCG
jgi:hypothetical protein